MKAKKMIGILGMVVLLVGCVEQTNTQTHRNDNRDTMNVRMMDQGYLMYEIEHGRVTCREHRSRPELACWRN